MFRFPPRLAGALLGLAVIATPIVALAGHGRPGLWRFTIKMGGQAAAMPDASQIPPEALARMKAMGMSMPGMGGGGMTVTRCRTPEEVAQDRPPTTGGRDCTLSNVQVGPGGMSADTTCHGDFEGTGHLHFTWDADTHFAGEAHMVGSAHGHAVDRTQSIEGEWISADCGAAN